MPDPISFDTIAASPADFILARAERLFSERDAAAVALDEALANLQKAASAWVAANVKCAGTAAALFATVHGNPADLSPPPHAPELLGGLGNGASNAITAQVEEATRGIDLRAHMAFNYQRTTLGEPELVAQYSRTSGASLLRRMHAAVAEV